MKFDFLPSLESSPNQKVAGPKWKMQRSHKDDTEKILKKKALSKTLKFRAVTLVTTLGITWLLTGNPVTSVGLTVLQQGTNTAVYYLFEKNDSKRRTGLQSS